MARPSRQSGPRPNRRKDRPAPPTGVGSRLAAADLIHRVIDGGADLETALAQSTPFNALSGSDRGFARAIASAALRGLGRIDYAIGGMLDRPLDAIEPPVRAVLLAGAAQLWVMGVADHAAVSSTVEAARAWREASRGGGLVNAVLRRAAREREAFDTAPAVSVWPDWLAARLAASLGPERAAAMAEAQLLDPPVDLTLKPGEDPEQWGDRLLAEALPNGSLRLSSAPNLAELKGYAEGQWWVQDAAATLAAKVLGDIAGKTVVDLCAAPGGKALQLAAAGAKLTAVDISAQRLGTLRQNAERMKLPMQVVEADARSWRPPERVDAVLLDAPCSALGTLRRHPEGAWRRDPAGLARYPAIQLKLIEAAGEMLKPGGVLAYCVCTPLREEGLDVVAAATAAGWRRRPIQPHEVPGFAHSLTPEGDLLTAPRPESGRDENESAAPENKSSDVMSDVFFVARLERA